MSKREVLDEFRAAFGDLDALIRHLSEAALTEAGLAGWSIKDVLSHFRGYHRDMTVFLDRHARGESPLPPDFPAFSDDEWNARFAAEAAAQSPSEVITSWREAFARCLYAAAQLTEERFGPGKPPAQWLREESAHYRDHTAEVRGWLIGRAGPYDGAPKER